MTQPRYADNEQDGSGAPTVGVPEPSVDADQRLLRAAAAAKRGARVRVYARPVAPSTPPGESPEN